MPLGVEPDGNGGEHQIALSAALEAAEETLTENAFRELVVAVALDHLDLARVLQHSTRTRDGRS